MSTIIDLAESVLILVFLLAMTSVMVRICVNNIMNIVDRIKGR